MPKAARLPALKMTDEQNKKQNEYIHNNFEMNRIRKGDKRGELENLYNKCVQEIDERYKHMEDMKKLGKNVDSEIMAEIKERINDMKSIEKLIEDYDKEPGKNK